MIARTPRPIFPDEWPALDAARAGRVSVGVVLVAIGLGVALGVAIGFLLWGGFEP